MLLNRTAIAADFSQRHRNSSSIIIVGTFAQVPQDCLAVSKKNTFQVIFHPFTIEYMKQSCGSALTFGKNSNRRNSPSRKRPCAQLHAGRFIIYMHVRPQPPRLRVCENPLHERPAKFATGAARFPVRSEHNRHGCLMPRNFQADDA